MKSIGMTQKDKNMSDDAMTKCGMSQTQAEITMPDPCTDEHLNCRRERQRVITMSSNRQQQVKQHELKKKKKKKTNIIINEDHQCNDMNNEQCHADNDNKMNDMNTDDRL